MKRKRRETVTVTKPKGENPASATVRRIMRETVVMQAMVHQTEITILAQKLQMTQDGLRDAIRLLDATRRNEWTPADTKRLEEIRSTANG